MLAVVVLAAGCAGTPPIADGTLADAKARVIALVNETGAAIGPRAPDVHVVAASELPRAGQQSVGAVDQVVTGVDGLTHVEREAPV